MIKLFPLISIINKRKNYSITESIISKSNTFILNLSIETTIERMSRKTTIFIKFHEIYKSSLQKKKKKRNLLSQNDNEKLIRRLETPNKNSSFS